MVKNKKKQPTSLYLQATASFEPLFYELSNNNGFTRDYDCRNHLKIKFTDLNDDEGSVALMKLNVCTYPDTEFMMDAADVNRDSLEAAVTARDFIKIQYGKEDDMEDFKLTTMEGIAVCEIHTLYISPEYRGLHLSKRLFFMVPTLLLQYLGIEYAICTCYINPFKEQGRLSDPSYDPNKEGYQYDHKNKTLIETMKEAILKAGFIQTDESEKRFAADTFMLRKNTRADGIMMEMNDEFI